MHGNPHPQFYGEGTTTFMTYLLFAGACSDELQVLLNVTQEKEEELFVKIRTTDIFLHQLDKQLDSLSLLLSLSLSLSLSLFLSICLSHACSVTQALVRAN